MAYDPAASGNEIAGRMPKRIPEYLTYHCFKSIRLGYGMVTPTGLPCPPDLQPQYTVHTTSRSLCQSLPLFDTVHLVECLTSRISR